MLYFMVVVMVVVEEEWVVMLVLMYDSVLVVLIVVECVDNECVKEFVVVMVWEVFICFVNMEVVVV